MYAGERANSTGLSDNETTLSNAEGNPELGRGVEVIELANGETIWYVDTGCIQCSSTNIGV